MKSIKDVVAFLDTRIDQGKKDTNWMTGNSILKKCGAKKRSDKLVRELNEALEEYSIEMKLPNGIESFKNVDLKQRIAFSRKAIEKKPLAPTKTKKVVTNAHAGQIIVSQGSNPRSLYPHQQQALSDLHKKLKKNGSFDGLLVLPTGGGKTSTAVQFILQAAINEGKKVLWVAHRHELLNQAYREFEQTSYKNLLTRRDTYSYRILSGKHDRPLHIQPTDELLIAGKDSLIKGENYLKTQWLQHTDDVMLVIDEAHHAPAKTYRRLIQCVKDTVKNVTLLGLTATPFRTFEQEQGYMKTLFKDDILYKIDLKELITRGILAEPHFLDIETKLDLKTKLSNKEIQTIAQFDQLPENIAKTIAESSERNRVIVKHYIDNKAKYGQTLIFAINQIQAVALSKLFQQYNICAEYVISGLTDEMTGATVANEHNAKHIQNFREGKLQVLINVNILTEGTDLPNVQTLFLTRPTISKILMTQMIGRALRGPRAGGTKDAYIVSFIDEWSNLIAWENPRSLVASTEIDDKPTDKSNKAITEIISIKMIGKLVEELLKTAEHSDFDDIKFMESVPVGVFAFELLLQDEDENRSRHCEVLVFESTEKSYKYFLEALPNLFAAEQIKNEYLTNNELSVLTNIVLDNYFNNPPYLPNYERQDIENLLNYYALTESVPALLRFEERQEIDVQQIAQTIWDEDMGAQKKANFLQAEWQRNQFLQIYFAKEFYFFAKCVDNEILKIQHPQTSEKPKSVGEQRSFEKLTLQEIRIHDYNHYLALRNTVFEKSQLPNGFYICAECGYTSPHRFMFHIDHIKPMSKGGLTIPNNLQLLDKKCNMVKADL
ncbi:DEAD/DEAH box helicase family protein [Neobacillus cucumis]|uniref:DEAD/DEAH box helicase family protein n=1 Tax=Neobacillus cucumis TaxID=1740721 RepID=UPI0019644FA5|nr:DEAD/DEAH box helicase family protein [Neobacillus cucumis]MBM7652496.1 superfamily II DNA or RNA helicase [Neobacillus cucumis]